MNHTAHPPSSSLRSRKVIPWLELAILGASLILPVFIDDFWTLFFTRVFILGLLTLICYLV